MVKIVSHHPNHDLLCAGSHVSHSQITADERIQGLRIKKATCWFMMWSVYSLSQKDDPKVILLETVKNVLTKHEWCGAHYRNLL